MRRWGISRSAVIQLLSIVLGITTTLLVALAAAALRPTDGKPNVLGDLFSSTGGPVYRVTTERGDIVVRVYGGSMYTVTELFPIWVRSPNEKPQWWKQFSYAGDLAKEQRESFHDPSTRPWPMWATSPSLRETEMYIRTSVWGWPFRCMSGTERLRGAVDTHGGLAWSRTEFEGYSLVGSKAPGVNLRLLPIRFLWSGLVLNSLAFGGLYWMIFFGPGYIRRAMRKWRGQCTRCAYQLRGLPPSVPCPECGHSLTSSDTQASFSPSSAASASHPASQPPPQPPHPPAPPPST